jgi:hypothetical protein
VNRSRFAEERFVCISLKTLEFLPASALVRYTALFKAAVQKQRSSRRRDTHVPTVLQPDAFIN